MNGEFSEIGHASDEKLREIGQLKCPDKLVLVYIANENGDHKFQCL